MLKTINSHPTLNQAEWSVVTLAIREAEHGIASAPPRPGSFRARIRSLWTFCTGIESAPGLANPRLELLRTFVLATRRSRRLAEQFVPALLSQGYNRPEIEAIALLAA